MAEHKERKELVWVITQRGLNLLHSRSCLGWKDGHGTFDCQESGCWISALLLHNALCRNEVAASMVTEDQWFKICNDSKQALKQLSDKERLEAEMWHEVYLTNAVKHERLQVMRSVGYETKLTRLFGSHGEISESDDVGFDSQEGAQVWITEHRIILKKEIKFDKYNIQHLNAWEIAMLVVSGHVRSWGRLNDYTHGEANQEKSDQDDIKNDKQEKQKPRENDDDKRKGGPLQKIMAAKMLKGASKKLARQEAFEELSLQRVKTLTDAANQTVAYVMKHDMVMGLGMITKLSRLEGDERRIVLSIIEGSESTLRLWEEYTLSKISDIRSVTDILTYKGETQANALLDDIKGDFDIVTCEQFVEVCWLTSMKEWNKLMHTINGNTNRFADFWGSNLSVTLSTSQTNILLLTNTSNRDIRWRSFEGNISVTSPTFTINGFTYMLQAVGPGGVLIGITASSTFISAPGNTIFDFKAFTFGAFSVALSTISTDKQVRCKDVTLPPGWSLYASLVGISVISAMTVIFSFGLTEGNVDLNNYPAMLSTTPMVVENKPVLPICTIDAELISNTLVLEDYNVEVRLNTNKWFVKHSKLKDRTWLSETFEDSAYKMSVRTKSGKEVIDYLKTEVYYVYISLIGGMVSDTPVVQEDMNRGIIDVKKKNSERKEIPSCLKVYGDKMHEILYTDESRLSTNGVTLSNVLSAWAGTLRSSTVIVQNVPAKVNTQWFESALGRIQAAVGGAYVATDVYDITLATSVNKPDSSPTPLWTAWDKYRKTGDLTTLGQTMRIKNDLMEGTGFVKTMIANAGQFLGGKGPSAAVVLLRALLYTAMYIPLFGNENGIYDGSVMQITSPPTLIVGSTNFPLAPVTLQTVPVNTRVIDEGTWIAMLSAYSLPVQPPAGFTLLDIGNSLVVVFMPQELCTNPDAASAYLLSHLEFPYLDVDIQVHLVDNYSNVSTLPVTGTNTCPTNSRVPAGTSVTAVNVLVVMLNVFGPNTNTEVVFGTAGGASAALNPGANGLGGVPVNIIPQLNAFMNGTFVTTSFDIAIETWYRLYGAKEDHSAAWITAASMSYMIHPYCNFSASNTPSDIYYYQPSTTGLLAPTYIANFTSPTPAVITGANLQSSLYASTKPDQYQVYTLSGVQQGQNVVRRIGIYDPASIYYKVAGFIDYANKAEVPRLRAADKVYKLRLLARIITAILDEVAAYMEADFLAIFDITTCSDQSQAFMWDVRRSIFKLMEMVFEYASGTELSMTYLPDLHSPPVANFYTTNFNSNSSIVTPTRVTRVNRTWILGSDTETVPDSSPIITKLDGEVKQTRMLNATGFLPPGAIVELLPELTSGSKNDLTMQKVLTQGGAVTSNHNPTPVINIFASIKNQPQSQAVIWIKNNYPNTGINIFLSMANYGCILASTCFAPDGAGSFDPPFYQHLPSTWLFVNYDINYMVPSNSYMFNTMSRNQTTQYLQRLMPDVGYADKSSTGIYNVPTTAQLRAIEYRPQWNGAVFRK